MTKLLKKEKSIKLEKKPKFKNNVKIESTATKWPRALFSEMLLPKRPYTYIKQ